MSQYITPTDLLFDPAELRKDCDKLQSEYGSNGKWTHRPISLRTVEHDVDDPVYHGAGSLVNGGVMWEKDSNWVRYIKGFEQLYVVDVCKQIEKYAAEQHGLRVGRCRLLTLAPKECYTYHRDTDNVLRIHVPIITNPNCFFVNNDIVGRMPQVGRAYLFDTKVFHTAINGSRIMRTHLVVNCYKV